MDVVSAFSMADLKAAILEKWRYILYIHSDEHKIRVGWSSHFQP
jgi:hypothetical protein